MCGIAGIVDPSLSRDELAAAGERMAATIVHRGPDDDGFLERPGVALAMRRLSIIDVAGGRQPILNEDGTTAVILNGEIYNYRELRGQLTARGHAFRTNADTEVIAHSYEDDGADAVAGLHGMFALALWDDREEQLLLARDRLGKKPLYYAHAGERLVFGSEIKALLAADPTLAQTDDEGLLPYLRYGFVPEPRTMFRDIHVLPPGTWLCFRHGEVSVHRYWSPELSACEEGTRSEDDYVEEFDALLADSVSRRLMSEVPLGLFLSGGLDSSTLTAYAARVGSGRLKTFTVGFDRKEWDERADAARVARRYGTEHHVLTLREQDLARALPETILSLARHLDQPFGDPSALPTYHVSKLAREHVTVILGGDGADELFAGYSTYRGISFAERYRRLPGSALLPRVLERAAALAPPGRRYRLLHAGKVLRDSLLPFEELYLRKKTILRAPDLARILAPELRSAIAASEPPAFIDGDVVSVLEADLPWVSRAGYGDLRFGLLNDMLVKVDRMSMAHSLEVRSPFLDHRLVEFALKLPPSLKLRRGETKVIMRKAVSRELPAATLRKPKQGFNVPLRDWFRGELSGLAADYLCGRDGLPSHLFDGRGIESLLDEHRAARADHSQTIWLLLSYAAWRRQLADEARSRRLAAASGPRLAQVHR